MASDENHLLRQKLIDNKSNVVLSADLKTTREIIDLIEKIGSGLCGVKLHSDCVADRTEDNMKRIVRAAFRKNLFIIEDKKFCDIGNTVKQQSSEIAKYADFITVHAIPGEGIIEGLRENCLRWNCKILLLAQMSSAGCLIDENYTKRVVEMAEKNRDVVAGFICQEFLADGFYHFAPGVKLNTAGDGLGQQYNTPEYLTKTKKVDILIVGRGLYQAQNPELEVIKYNTFGEGGSVFFKKKSKRLSDDPLIHEVSSIQSDPLTLKDFVENEIISFGIRTLKSGKLSYVYIDCRKLITQPSLMKKVSVKIHGELPRSENIVVAGVPMGGIPIASSVSVLFDIPMIMIRPARKKHGTKNLIEGDFEGKECVLIEDVVTTGGSVLNTIRGAEKEGLKIAEIIVIFDRQEGGVERLKNEGYVVKSLFQISDFFKARL